MAVAIFYLANQTNNDKEKLFQKLGELYLVSCVSEKKPLSKLPFNLEW